MAYEWLDREIDNLRAAFRWATDRADVDVAVGIASNIGDMGRFRLREEAALWAEEIVDAARAAGHRRLVYILDLGGQQRLERRPNGRRQAIWSRSRRVA